MRFPRVDVLALKKQQRCAVYPLAAVETAGRCASDNMTAFRQRNFILRKLP
jgi:hypothetical protein